MLARLPLDLLRLPRISCGVDCPVRMDGYLQRDWVFFQNRWVDPKLRRVLFLAFTPVECPLFSDWKGKWGFDVLVTIRNQVAETYFFLISIDHLRVGDGGRKLVYCVYL